MTSDGPNSTPPRTDSLSSPLGQRADSWYGMLGLPNSCYTTQASNSLNQWPFPPMVVSSHALPLPQQSTSGRSHPPATHSPKVSHPAPKVPRHFLPYSCINGESLIAFHPSTIELWDIKCFSSSPSVLNPPPDLSPFLLEFHPDRPLAALARKEGETVIVLDLKSGAPGLTIDTSIKVHGLRPTGNPIVVADDEKAVTWDLPGGNSLPGVRVNVEDSTRTIKFHDPSTGTVAAVSISPDSKYIAFAYVKGVEGYLDVYCTSTSRKLRGKVFALALRFVPGGHDIWCASRVRAEVFTVTQDAVVHTRRMTDIGNGSGGSPWGSPPGYKVTDDRLILGAGGKRLLMMPPLWASPGPVDRAWNGKFLALLHGGLPEPVILELEP